MRYILIAILFGGCALAKQHDVDVIYSILSQIKVEPNRSLSWTGQMPPTTSTTIPVEGKK